MVLFVVKLTLDDAILGAFYCYYTFKSEISNELYEVNFLNNFYYLGAVGFLSTFSNKLADTLFTDSTMACLS